MNHDWKKLDPADEDTWPPFGVRVMVYLTDGYNRIDAGTLYDSRYCQPVEWVVGELVPALADVTYWMPLPQPPPDDECERTPDPPSKVPFPLPDVVWK